MQTIDVRDNVKTTDLTNLPGEWSTRKEVLNENVTPLNNLGWTVECGNGEYILMEHVTPHLAALMMRSFKYLIGETDNYKILRRQWRHYAKAPWYISNKGQAKTKQVLTKPLDSKNNITIALNAAAPPIVARGVIALQDFFHGSRFRITNAL